MFENKFIEPMMRFFVIVLTILCWALPISVAKATDVRVAVASNFTPVARDIARAFEEETGLTVRLSFGSTGKLYAQIINGAPFDLFLAADAARPLLLEEKGYVAQGKRKVYAFGQLVLWSPKSDLITQDLSVLAEARMNRLALANPKTAPYGKAALTVLDQLGYLENLKAKIVQGNNIAQTLQFVASGNVDLGFIAASQAARLPEGSRWAVPQELHDPLVQEMVLLSAAKNKEATRKFYDFLSGPQALEIIKSYDYAF